MTAPFFTTTTAAAELGISASRVRAMIAAGRLAATLAGTVWVIGPKDLDAVRTRIPGRPPGIRVSATGKPRRAPKTTTRSTDLS